MTAFQLSGVPDALNWHVLLWAVGQGSFEPVVRSACDLLVEGQGGAAVAALAGLSIHEERWSTDVEGAIRDALAELGRRLPEKGSDEAFLAVLTGLSRKLLSGWMQPRALAAWAHRAIGHEGAAIAQPLVNLDDDYDLVEYNGYRSVEDVDAEVVAFCRELLRKNSATVLG